MTKRFLTLVAIALVASAAVARGQAAITGKWRGTTPNGFPLELNLTATRQELTGTLTRDGQSFAITDGKVSKNTFTFKVTMNDTTEGLTGEVDEDQLKVWLDRQGPSVAAVLKRVVPAKGESRASGRDLVYTPLG